MRPICFLLLAACFFAACKKTEDLGEARLFRPVIAGQLTADSNTIIAGWQRNSGATSYVLQVSRDTFRTVDVTMTLDTNVAVIKQLRFNQLYQLQVKAVAKDTALNSRWSFLGAIKTLSSILKEPAPSDVSFNSVRVRWTTKGAPVTRIRILKTADSSQAAESTLTPADLASEFKVVGGLNSNTRYTILLYSGADVRGSADFSTKAPLAGNIIDLSGISGRPSLLADTIAVIPSGSTVLLRRAEVYTIAATLNLTKSITIMSIPDLGNSAPARINLTSNFAVANGSTIDYIDFKDVYLVGASYTASYVFNTAGSGVTAAIGRLSFEDCKAEIFRGLVRLQSTGGVTVTNMVISTSIIDSIGNFGMLNVSSISKMENISITNSTIYKAEGVITSAQNSTSVLLESCTFNEAPLGNNSYYVNYGTSPTNNVTNGITIMNCIFGIGKSSAGAISVRGFRASATTQINVGNNYRTADHVSGGNDIPSIITSNRTSTQLWADPRNGNFTIADATFPGRSSAGDPRWRL
jgi:hypothetical protein